MFKEFRWRIAMWFVGLSMLVYLAIGISGTLFFHASLTHALDQELKVFASELGHAVDLDGSKPLFRNWARIVETDPSSGLATIQLFDAQGNLLERYGPRGIPQLFNGQVEAGKGDLNVRLRSTPLLKNGRVLGYLQIQLPTKFRDASTRQIVLMLFLGAPLVVLCFGICSYVVSGKAAEPIHENVRMLQRFVADAGHELNTPLSIVQARAESLERKLSKQGAPIDDLEIIRRAGQRMAKIVSDLMLLAEMESPLTTATRLSAQLDQAVAPLVLAYSSRFSDKGVEFIYESIPSARVLVFPDSIERLVGNLLENALRYTDAPGSVSLAVKAEGTDISIKVRDSGVGIPAENVPHIFDRFYRVDKSRSRASGGVGLGLAIVKAIVDVHHGKIDVQSQPGKGSTFTVTLPVVDVRGAEMVAQV